jgi:hypothetical protein
MKTVKLLGVALGLVVSLIACAGQQTWTPQVNYAYEVDDGVLYIRWNCFAEPPGLVMRGFVNNPMSMNPLKDTTLWLSGINAQGATISSTQDNAIPFMLETMNRTPFEMKLKTTGTEARFDMWYQYQIGAFLRDQRGAKMDACPNVRF